jgi:HEAT repeat protein
LTRDPICRRAALRAAAASPEPQALSAIAQALSDANAALSSAAAVAASIAARRGRRDSVRQALLARTGAARVLRHLCERAQAPEVRRAAVECLGLIADPASVAAVLRAAQSPETSAAADEALDRFGSEAVAGALAAAEGLGSQGTGALLRWALQRAAPHDHPELVRVAWRALEAGEGGVAAWDVVAAVGTYDDALRLLAKLAQRAAVIDPHEHARPLVMLLARYPELAPRMSQVAPLASHLGLVIAEACASAGFAVPIEPLREALTAPDALVRAAAVRALAASSEPSARDGLEFALADEDAAVQAAAAEALGALGLGHEVLLESLRATDPRVRQAAARALARRGGDVRAALVPVLDDPDPAVVLAALEGLGGQATDQDLLGLTTHADPDVAAEALVRLRAHSPAVASQAARAMLDHAVWSVRLEAVRSLDASDEALRGVLRARRGRERDELVREAIDGVLGESDSAPGGGGGRP